MLLQGLLQVLLVLVLHKCSNRAGRGQDQAMLPGLPTFCLAPTTEVMK
uniref:Uncharacterized protein n=1 Tax=Arundo donax TaxID=35708 RepID=A0A0A9CCI4_ARUDO